MNPADFFMDVIAGKYRRSGHPYFAPKVILSLPSPHRGSLSEPNCIFLSHPFLLQDLFTLWEASEEYKGIAGEAEEVTAVVRSSAHLLMCS